MVYTSTVQLYFRTGHSGTDLLYALKGIRALESKHFFVIHFFLHVKGNMFSCSHFLLKYLILVGITNIRKQLTSVPKLIL